MLFHKFSRRCGITGQNRTVNQAMFLVNFLQLLLVHHTGSADMLHQIANGLNHAVDYGITGTGCNAQMKFQIAIKEILKILTQICFMNAIGIFRISLIAIWNFICALYPDRN